MARFCDIFYCDERGDRYCCADCHLRRDCSHPCLNHPSRCKCEDPEGKPTVRRGSRSRLPAKRFSKK